MIPSFRTLWCTAASALWLGLAGPAAADALDTVISGGKLIVAIDPTFAPFEYTDSAGKSSATTPS